MSENIFQIWDRIGRKTPFAVRRENWPVGFYTIVETIECEKMPYGKAFGYPTNNGNYTNHYEYDNRWRKEKLVPCCGCYQWIYEENADLSKYKDGLRATEINIKGAKTIKSIFYFGKYKGEDLNSIFDRDPGYIEWSINNINGFYLSIEVIEYLENKHGNGFKFKAETHKANKEKMPKTTSKDE